jgi:hypothetical protein
VNRQAQTEDLRRRERGRRMASGTVNSKLSIILRDREKGEGSAKEERRKEGNEEGDYGS